MAFGMKRLQSWVARKFSGSFLPRYDVFHLSRVAERHLSGGRPVFPQVLQCRSGAVLASSKLTQATQRPLDVARGVMFIHLVSPERPCRCVRTDVRGWPIGRSPVEATIISTAMGRRRAFASDMRERLRRENAAYGLRAAGCLIGVPEPNTCKLVLLTRAIRRGFGRRNRSQ